jgi:hypothetical protein
MKHKENLSKIFDLDYPIQETKSTEIAPIAKEVSDEEDDYQLARRTMRSIIQKSDNTLEEILELARSTEHARTYEVAGQLIKTMSEVSKDLLALHAQKKELTKVAEKDQHSIGQQNNIVFAGSTQDLLKMLKDGDNIIDQ